MTDLALLLLQEGGNYSAIGVFRFFVGFLLVIGFFTSFLGFTYWISKDE